MPLSVKAALSTDSEVKHFLVHFTKDNNNNRSF
jgi:hypothetical protein